MIFLYKILIFWDILILGYTDEYYNACGYRYFFGTKPITQEEYTEICQQKSMEKLSLKTENDLRCLTDIVSSKSLASLSGNYWTSATSNDGKTDFKWQTQEPVLTKFWRDGFPKTRSGEFKCTILVLKSKYSSMENVFCEKSFRPICQATSVDVAQAAQQNTQTCSATCPKSSSTKEMSYQNAENFCNALERTVRKCGDFYVKMLSLESINRYSCLRDDGQKGTFWTSARDDGCPKKFAWCSDPNTSGKSVNESLWQSGAPDNFKGKERCAVVNFKTGLNDRNCELSYTAACEVAHRTIKMFEVTTPRPEICRPFETNKKSSKKNTIAPTSPEKYHSIGAWTSSCKNLYHISYAEMNRKKAFEYCISLGMELLYIDSEEEMSCLYKYINSTDAIKTKWYWTSGACTDCPNRYFWCTGPGEEVKDEFWKESKSTDEEEIHVAFDIEEDSEDDDDDEEDSDEETEEEDEEEEADDEEEEIEDSSDHKSYNSTNTTTTKSSHGLKSIDETEYDLNVICKLPGGTTPKPCNTDCRNVTSFLQKNNLGTTNDVKKLEKLGTLIQACRNEYLLSKKAMNKTEGDKFCSSIGFELFWTSTDSEIDCLIKEFEGQLFEAWTSGISSEICPRAFRWCSGPSNLPVTQAVESDEGASYLKILELCVILDSYKEEDDNDTLIMELKSRKCSDKKVKALCKKPFGIIPATTAPNKLQTTMRPAPTFQIKISGPINMLPNIKMCVPICAPFKPKDMAQSAASQFCGSLGMTLLTVDSVRDLDCLKNSLPILGVTDVWTAAADISCSRRFQWCGNNIAVVDAMWASDQPPYSDQQRCARLSKSRLKRENCNVVLKALCQSPAKTINIT